jgi:hypothetical protein
MKLSSCIARRVSTLRGRVPGESRQVRVRCERKQRPSEATGCREKQIGEKQRAKNAAKGVAKLR